MSMIKCGNCDNEISPKSASCPKCGHPNDKAKNLSGKQVFMGLALTGVMIWFMANGGFEGHVANEMQKIENKVAIDAENQYLISARQGDPIQICVQAGMVSAAYLQAKDEPNYRKWKATEEADCRRAKVTR